MGIRKDMGDLVAQIADLTEQNAELTEQLKAANEALAVVNEDIKTNTDKIAKLQEVKVVPVKGA